MDKADALLIVPEDRQQVVEGEILEAIFLAEPVHVRDVPF
jgi:hypothetical protein